MPGPLIFQSIFAVPWTHLPPVMQNHYAVRADSLDRVTLKGVMNVRRGWLTRILAPALNVCGALLPFDGDNIPATVVLSSGLGCLDLHMDRLIEPPGRKPIRFHSRLVPLGGGDVVEMMRFGLGWRARYTIEGGGVRLRQIDYVWRFGGTMIPLPLSYIIGVGSAAEEVVSATRFKMWMAITHPVFGETYRYEGLFDIAGVTLG